MEEARIWMSVKPEEEEKAVSVKSLVIICGLIQCIPRVS